MMMMMAKMMIIVIIVMIFGITREYMLELQASTCRTFKRDIALCARHHSGTLRARLTSPCVITWKN